MKITTRKILNNEKWMTRVSVLVKQQYRTYKQGEEWNKRHRERTVTNKQKETMQRGRKRKIIKMKCERNLHKERNLRNKYKNRAKEEKTKRENQKE